MPGHRAHHLRPPAPDADGELHHQKPHRLLRLPEHQHPHRPEGPLPGGERPGCRNELLNSQKLFLADKAADYRRIGLWAQRLLFTTENPRECVQVAQRYLEQGSWAPNEYTRGLYYRDVE